MNDVTSGLGDTLFADARALIENGRTMKDAKTLHDRIHTDMIDSFDEELELEIDDERLARLLAEMAEHPDRAGLDRRIYFKELFRLQGELVKLQDWVQSQKLDRKSVV